MAQITLKDLSQTIDVAQIAADARTRWEREQRKRLSVEQWLLALLPFGLIVMVVVFFLLSAPHTIDMLDMITPGFGWVAPVGFEVGILVISALIEAGWSSWLTRGLLSLLIGMAVLINTAGAFMVVVASAGAIQGDTFLQLIERYPSLPATTQAVLFLVLPVGVAVPVISKFAGEAVVKLALGKVELNKTSLDDLWGEVEQREVKSALMQAALNAGAGVKTSGKWASQVVEEMYRDDLIAAQAQQTVVRELRPGQITAQMGQTGQGQGQGQPRYGFVAEQTRASYDPEWTVIDTKDSPGQSLSDEVPRLSSRQVREWLGENGDRWQSMSNHDISREIIGSDSGYKTVQRVLRQLNLRR